MSVRRLRLKQNSELSAQAVNRAQVHHLLLGDAFDCTLQAIVPHAVVHFAKVATSYAQLQGQEVVWLIDSGSRAR